MHQHLEESHTLMNQYFLNDHCMMLQNQAWVKNTYSNANRTMDFNATGLSSLT